MQSTHALAKLGTASLRIFAIDRHPLIGYLSSSFTMAGYVRLLLRGIEVRDRKMYFFNETEQGGGPSGLVMRVRSSISFLAKTGDGTTCCCDVIKRLPLLRHEVGQTTVSKSKIVLHDVWVQAIQTGRAVDLSA
jgi:hypothetical protein